MFFHKKTRNVENHEKNTKSIRKSKNATEFIRNVENGMKPIENDGNAIVSVVRHEKHLNSWNNTEMYQASVDFSKKQQHLYNVGCLLEIAHVTPV